MRLAQLFEENGHITNWRRLWISPDGKIVNMEEHGGGHNEYVRENPEEMGITPEELAACRDPDVEISGVEWDTDKLIYLGHAKGWVRVSSPSKSELAISGGNIRQIRKALVLALPYYPNMKRVTVEVSTSDSMQYAEIDAEQIPLFLRTGACRLRRYS